MPKKIIESPTLRCDLEDLIRSGSTFASLPTDYHRKFQKKLADQHQGKLKKKLLNLFPDLQIVDDQFIMVWSDVSPLNGGTQNSQNNSFSCHYCDRILGSDYALLQHYCDEHPYACDYCDREFRSEGALEQHINAKHPDDLYACDYCDREFRSEESLENHTNAKHPFEPEVFEGVPFEGAEGEWVYRDDFKGKKGFGLFVCTSCSRHWMSAHAHRDLYGQGCQSCEKKIFAYIMWQSYGHRKEKELVSDGPPHDASRCDACKAGDYCTKIPSQSQVRTLQPSLQPPSRPPNPFPSHRVDPSVTYSAATSSQLSKPISAPSQTRPGSVSSHPVSSQTRPGSVSSHPVSSQTRPGSVSLCPIPSKSSSQSATLPSNPMSMSSRSTPSSAEHRNSSPYSAYDSSQTRIQQMTSQSHSKSPVHTPHRASSSNSQTQATCLLL
jgi:hypothetical protein